MDEDEYKGSRVGSTTRLTETKVEDGRVCRRQFRSTRIDGDVIVSLEVEGCPGSGVGQVDPGRGRVRYGVGPE